MKHRIAPIVFAIAVAAIAPAHATTVALAADGQWNEFTVDDQASPTGSTAWIDYADGSTLSFDFTVAAGSTAKLTVVDAGFAGDSFYVTNHGAVIGRTSNVVAGTTNGPVEFDFDAALANPAYSSGTFTFAAGSYSIGGLLKQSVTGDDGLALDATNGAVRLQVSAVPEPANAALLLAGLGLLGLSAHRRARRAGR